MEKEEEATSFTLETVDKSWAGLSEWVPGQVVMFIKYIYYKFNIYILLYKGPLTLHPKELFQVVPPTGHLPFMHQPSHGVLDIRSHSCSWCFEGGRRGLCQ